MKYLVEYSVQRMEMKMEQWSSIGGEVVRWTNQSEDMVIQTSVPSAPSTDPVWNLPSSKSQFRCRGIKLSALRPLRSEGLPYMYMYLTLPCPP